MAGITIPTTAQQAAINKANIEARLNQTTPAADKAYNTVLGTTEAMAFTTLYKYAADRSMANLWISAQGPDLDYLGSEYRLPRQTAVAAIVTATLAATDATVIPIGQAFTSTANGLTYTTTAQVTAPNNGGTGTGALLTLQCTTAGSSGNLSNASTMSIQNPIAGAGSVATVVSTVTTGTDAELDGAYRARGLSLVQSLPNGSNAASYRCWALSVPGVVGAYPYAGPPNNSTTAYPGMRTVYVRCATSLQVQGVAGGTWTPSTQVGTGLIGQVAAAIITNASTGIGNQDLGLVNTTLYVVPIVPVLLSVQMTTLTVPSGLTAACVADITTALVAYCAQVAPYIAGVDPVFGRNDTISLANIYSVINGVLVAYGATVSNVTLSVGGSNTPAYTLNPGEIPFVTVPAPL